jgi:UDP:flavonoid glycosyltransferase YjiC (YdhE family)
MRILFTAIPTHSHIAPMLPLVDSAVRAGHEVIFVTGAEGIPLVDRSGVDAVEMGRTWAESSKWYGDLLEETRPSLRTPDEALLHYVLNVFTGYLATGMATELVPFAARRRPDVVISETSEIAGRAAAIHAGVPHIVHGFGPQQSATLVPPVTDDIIRLQASYGIPDDVSRRWNRGLYLDIWPAVLDDDSSKMFTEVLPIRSAVVAPARPADAVLDGLPHARTVYVTLGTMFNATPVGARALEKLASVFDQMPVNAIITVGRDGDVTRFDRSRENVRVRHFIPQDALLPYVDAVLSHGGAGTALGALAHGVPHVMMPIATDQHRIAAKVADAGAGIVIDDESSVEEIAAAVDAVLEDRRYTDGARAAAPILHAIPDADHVLNQVLDFVRSQGADRPIGIGSAVPTTGPAAL